MLYTLSHTLGASKARHAGGQRTRAPRCALTHLTPALLAGPALPSASKRAGQQGQPQLLKQAFRPSSTSGQAK